jgi:hypothetical protein
LEKLHELAEPALQNVLQGKPALEVRQRVEQLLEKLHGPITNPEQLRMIRAVEVLEHIGTPEAKQVLRSLAKGAPEARLTKEAMASLERLAKRSRAQP